MAFMAKSTGLPVSTLANDVTPHWTSATQTNVQNDLAQIH